MRSHRLTAVGGRAALTLVLVALVAAACGGAATPPPSWPAGSLIVTTKDRLFDTKELQIKGDADTTLVLVNRDSDPHNIAIRTRSGFDGDLLFRFDPVSAMTLVVSVGPLPPGSYFFLCEVHPTMSGTVFVY